METKSYSKDYLPYVAENLGTMLEYSAACGFKPDEFWNMFVLSDVAKGIEKGTVRFLVGYSAIDLTNYVINTVSAGKPILSPEHFFERSSCYWAGWVLAQYQYYCGKTFFDINKALPIETVLKMYHVLHEADVTKFFDIADERMRNSPSQSKLKRIRLARGISQKELAERSGVDIRSIQMYEQRRNDINKARAETLLNLSKVLGCTIEELLE